MVNRAIHSGSLIVALLLVASAWSGSDSSGESTTTAGAEPTTTTSVASTTSSTGERPPVTCREPIKVGVITDRSGPLALYGAHVMRGFPLGMEYATGAVGSHDTYLLDNCEIEVLYRDDASDPETGAVLARELIEVDDVDIIVGSVDSDVTAEIQDVAFEAGVIHIAAPAAANALTGANFNPNSFRTSRNNYQDAVNMCRHLTDEYGTYVQIAPDDSFGHGGAAAFRDACTFFGGEFVGEDIFVPATTTDFTPYMDEILESAAEVLLVTWAGGGFVPLRRAARESGVLDEMVVVSTFIDNQLMPAIFVGAEGSASGILYHYTLPDNPINDWMVDRVRAEFDTQPDLFDADAFNAALLITESLKATGGNTGADALREAIEGISFAGPKGTIEIRAQDHVAVQDMYIAVLDNLDDAQSRFFDLIATNQPEVPCLLEADYADRCGDLPTRTLGGALGG
jgi:branched-chain amino acid transport system substrate-binding protein